MLLLTDLPPEIVHHILGYVNPQDLAQIPRTCKNLYYAVSNNPPLFKQVYLNHLDTPSRSLSDWEQAVKDFVRLQTIFNGNDNDDRKRDELDFVHRTVTQLLENASTDGEGQGLAGRLPRSRNVDILSSLFSSESNRLAFLCRSFIYERARAEFHERSLIYWRGPPKPEHQRSAHLHCLYGVPQLFAYPSADRQTGRSLMYPFACSKVYDLRQYTDNNKWGPFMDDGSMNVDWEKVEAVMIVIGATLRHLGISRLHLCKHFRSVPFAGTWPNSWQSPHPPSLPREIDAPELRDPYGVTGAWLRVVCFLDYSDFFAFNFASQELPPHIPRPTVNMGQATRLIFMSIFVTKIENPGPEDGQELPVVYFKGSSTSLDRTFDGNADSGLRGIVLIPIAEEPHLRILYYWRGENMLILENLVLTKRPHIIGHVRLTPKGDVRWTTFSVFGGVERWRSEGIQIGGLGSAKGVLGHWFDKDFDPHGPVGPSAFWKISDSSRSAHDTDEQDDDLFSGLDDFVGDPDTSQDEEGGEEENDNEREGTDSEEEDLPSNQTVPGSYVD